MRANGYWVTLFLQKGKIQGLTGDKLTKIRVYRWQNSRIGRMDRKGNIGGKGRRGRRGRKVVLILEFP
jgi:hypothetical protein